MIRTRRNSQQRTEDVRWGLRYGAVISIAYSTYVVALAGLQRSTYFKKYDLELFQIIAVYCFAGVVGGTLVGLLRPMVHTKLGKAFVAIIVGMPIVGAIFTALSGLPFGWSFAVWAAYAFCVVIASPIFALLVFR